MLKITKKLTMPIGHKLLNYEGGCKNVHGHNFTIEVTFSSDELDGAGFVVDFNEIKDGIGKELKDRFDHAFLVNPYDANMIAFLIDNKMKYYIMPRKSKGRSLAAIGLSNPSIENFVEIVKELSIKFAHKMGIDFENARVYESETGWVDLN